MGQRTSYNTINVEANYRTDPDINDVVSSYYTLLDIRLRSLIQESRAIERVLIDAGLRDKSIFRVKQ